MKKVIGCNLLLGLIATFFLSACGSKNYYQIYAVQSLDVPVVDNHFVYSNEDVFVRYNFCKESGDMTFYCFNKNDKIIYIQLDNSFYINNGIAHDYYRGLDYTTTLATSSGQKGSTGVTATNIYGLTRGFDFGAYASTSQGVSVTYHSPHVIAIPPQCAKYIDGFAIKDVAELACGDEMHNQNYPKKSSRLFTYGANESPTTFSNHISYSFDMDGSDLHSFVNNFYVSSMQNKAEKEVLEKNPNYKYTVGAEVKDACVSNQKYILVINSPMVFYNIYTK